MSLFLTLSVSASGMAAQRKRAELLAENLANAETTRTPQGGPYRRKDVVFSSDDAVTSFDSLFQSETRSAFLPSGSSGASGVQIAEVVEDTRSPEKRYLPGHPDADAEGYVAFPNVHPAEDMVDLMSASRSYDANVAAMNAVKDMIHRTVDLLRS